MNTVTIALAAISLALLAACGGGGGKNSDSLPSSGFPDGPWQVVVVGASVKNDSSLSPIPSGSVFVVSGSRFVSLTFPGGAPADLDQGALEGSMGTVFDSYNNLVADPPSGGLGYVWDHLSIGGSFLGEVFTIDSLAEDRMHLSHDYLYQDSSSDPSIFLQTSYVLFPVASLEIGDLLGEDAESPTVLLSGGIAAWDN